MRICYNSDSNYDKVKVEFTPEDKCHGVEASKEEIIEAISHIITDVSFCMDGWSNSEERHELLLDITNQIYRTTIFMNQELIDATNKRIEYTDMEWLHE